MIGKNAEMAKSKKKPEPKLTLKIDGDAVTADRFLKGLSAFVALINDVADNVSERNHALSWVVSVEHGSNIVHFSPRPRSADISVIGACIKAIDEGFEVIEQRVERPRFWSDMALKKVKDLSEILDIASQSVNHISVKSGENHGVVTKKTSQHVDQLIGSEKSALGTIEGKLRTVTEGGGLHFVVHDAITQNAVRCYFDDTRTDEIIAAFRCRVAVYGEIRYRSDGEPISIKVHNFRVFRDRSKLPSVNDVRGILSA